MAKGPIRSRAQTHRRDELGPEPGLMATADGASVPRAMPMVPAAPTPVDPQALGRRWAQMEVLALDVLEDGVRGRFEDPAVQRERRQAAEAILGVRRGGLPLPAIGGALREVTAQDRVIQLRWADGRLVKMPLHRPDQVDEVDDDDA
jgi:hypothetical protein